MGWADGQYMVWGKLLLPSSPLCFIILSSSTILCNALPPFLVESVCAASLTFRAWCIVLFELSLLLFLDVLVGRWVSCALGAKLISLVSSEG